MFIANPPFSGLLFSGAVARHCPAFRLLPCAARLKNKNLSVSVSML